MSDEHHSFATRVTHVSRPGIRSHGFVNGGVHRGSTVLYPSSEARQTLGAAGLDKHALTYGTSGGPTHFALEDAIAEVEGGTRCLIVGTGLAACAVPLMAYLKAGDHCLVPDSAYGPTRRLCDGLLAGWGIETTYYDPTIDAEGLRSLMRPNTRVLYTESPGSHTFELQDIPALAAVAHAQGAKVLMDNTWGIHHFQPFKHGVDVSIQALTKYVGGHSDVLLGSVVVNTEEDWTTVASAGRFMGHYASPDDCWLALRGLRTMAVRLKHQEAAGLEVARWFESRPEVLRVLHPALPSHPQHALFKRDFTGACSLFGVVFQPRYTRAQADALVDGLKLFGIGASWGGFESLALATTGFVTRTATSAEALGGPAVRFHIGLEDTADLIADLEAGMARLA
ncbi:cystathionine beta-lyase [Roseomonas haemaphysalidis]|uniref:Cystathionine beta-lyase n=1 Tax=Roseomonas haemaphysalidis TaxID=2768162 RepID=A0ABS3KPK1_9PROT|nr:cystathionine beta-lyase [Roseomonas haemaphysalidis]MBO1078947.1 cystathionine beta-lyase [Roseomonas haemaphysalidis]